LARVGGMCRRHGRKTRGYLVFPRFRIRPRLPASMAEPRWNWLELIAREHTGQGLRIISAAPDGTWALRESAASASGFAREAEPSDPESAILRRRHDMR
ncbi:hypothetical protein, partial [Streptomyces sp. BpilaLS-43]|uniref:hypothetical protein n=1 Tax=Streptomyces sp. BpilaLS-43 TaxID=1839778 RepID=UPI001C4025DB